MSTLASAGRIDTRNVDEHRQVIQPWGLILRQMSPGPFHGRVEYVQVNGILLYREHCSRRVVATGATPPGYCVFAAATGVHQRVLELAFQEALGITPRKYLRWNRMNQARRELLATAVGSASVKEIAAQWDFSEPGRFAVEYKRLFDESPSKTLARSAGARPLRLADALCNSAGL